MKKLDIKILIRVRVIGDALEKPVKGDKLYLVREPSNKFDKDAIAVCVKSAPDSISIKAGYVANSEKTLFAGEPYVSASSIQNLFKGDEAIEVVIKEEIDDNKGMYFYHGEIVMENNIKDNNEQVANKKIKLSLMGGFTVHGGKKALIEDYRKGINCAVTLEANEDMLITGFYKGASVGVIKQDDDFEKCKLINSILKDPNIKTITQVVGMQGSTINCEMEAIGDIKEVRTNNIKNIINNILKNGIDTRENIDRKLKYLEQNNVPGVSAKAIFESYVEYPSEVAVKIPNPETLYVDSSGLVRRSIAYMNIKRNLLYEGEKGTGKNALTETMAWLYNRPLYEFSLNSQHSNSSLLGTQTFEDESLSKPKKGLLKSVSTLLRAFGKGNIKETDLEGTEEILDRLLSKDNKKLVFSQSPIIEAFENGGIIVLDEFNTSLAHVMPIFNSLLDERRRMSVPLYGEVVAHDNAIAIATQNLSYQGTFETNEATSDRFVPLVFPKCENITEILRAKVGFISEYNLSVVEKVYEGIKSQVEMGELDSKAITIRGFIDACLVLEQDIPLKEALIDNVANRTSDLESREIIGNIISLNIG